MIVKFKIRTLDSSNEEFEVDDQITVRELKEYIKERMGIDPALQRLIFSGKVLDEESKLDQLDLNGMVMHLVTRQPPSPESRQAALRLSRLRSIPFNMRDTIARMSNLKRLIRELDTSFIELSDHVYEDHPGNIYPTLASQRGIEVSYLNSEVGASGDSEEGFFNVTSGTEEVADLNLESIDNLDADMLSENADLSSSGAQELAEDGTRHQQLTIQFSSLMSQLSELQSDCAPFVNLYSDILQNFNGDYYYTEDQIEHSQHTLHLIAKLMHSLAHALHTASDILVLLRSTGAQLTSLHSFPMRPSFPMQHSSQTGAGSPQPGPSRAPDHITYQVEIETRVPIAFAVDNALIGNLAQNEGQNIDPAMPANLQQGLESLLREITQNGVQAGLEAFSLQNAASLFENNGVGPNIVNLSGHQNVDSNQSRQAPVQATGPATNQGGGPLTSNTQAERTPVSRMAATATTPNQPIQNQPTQNQPTQNQPTQNQPTQNQPTQNQPTQNQPTQNQATQNQTTPNQPIQNQPTQPHTVPRMRSAVIRGMLLPEHTQFNHSVRQTEDYDSYLPCESCFVKNTVPWRRALGELFTQLRMRNRETAQNFNTFAQVAENFTPNTITVIQNILNQVPASTASYLVAVMTCLARQFYTPEVMEPLGALPGLIPSEFPRIRALLREGLRLINDVDEPASREQAENVVNHLIVRHEDLLNCLNSDIYIHRQYDFTLSITALLHDRMPAVVASILSRNEDERLVHRFYSLFGQLYIDMGALVTRMCGGDLHRVRIIFETALDSYIQTFPWDIRTDVVRFCVQIYNYYKRRYYGQHDVIMNGVERYLRPFAGATPEESSEYSDTSPQPLNLRRLIEEAPISHSSPFEGFSGATSETSPSVVELSFSGNILDRTFEFPSETPRPSTSNTPPLSAVNKKGFKDTREKSKRLIAKVLELSAAKRKTSLTLDTTRTITRPLNLMDCQSSPEQLLDAQNLTSPETLQSPRNNSVTTPQDSSDDSLRQRESRRISITPRPSAANVTPGPPQTPDHSTLEAEKRVETEEASESNVRRSRPLRRSFFETPPAGVEVEDILEGFKRRYFNEPSPTGDPRIDEEIRSRRRFFGSPQASRSTVVNTVTRPIAENLNSLPTDVSINMDNQGDSPRSASLYFDSPTAGASVSDCDDSTTELAEFTDSTSVVSTETCVKDNTSEPARFVDPPTAMATGSVSDLNMSSRPTSSRLTSQSLNEEAMWEPVRRLYPPNLAEILVRDQSHQFEQEPSSVTMSSRPTSESIGEVDIWEPVRRLYPPNLAEILVRDESHQLEQEPSSVTMSSRPTSESIGEADIWEPVRRLYPPNLAEILARDINQRVDQEPFSDAYLSGRSQRLQRVVRQQRPATAANTLLRDVLQEASPSGSAAEDTNPLRIPFRNNVEEIIADRSSTSQNFSQRRFQATSRICDIVRQRMQQPPPEDTDSDDD